MGKHREGRVYLAEFLVLIFQNLYTKDAEKRKADFACLFLDKVFVREYK
jgi:hypothetical protein